MSRFYSTPIPFSSNLQILAELIPVCVYDWVTVAGALESLSAMADMHLKGGVASPFLVNLDHSSRFTTH